MPTRLEEEIKQTRPFASLEAEAYVSVERTAAVLEHAVSEALKGYGVTPTQYNVLRILRGAGENGLCRGEIWERMVARVPDVTRLLDRMEATGLVERERSAADRRFVTTRITEEGLRILEASDRPMEELHRRLLGHVGEADLRTLVALLARAREAV